MLVHAGSATKVRAGQMAGKEANAVPGFHPGTAGRKIRSDKYGTGSALLSPPAPIHV